jgi:hypothetical protein
VIEHCTESVRDGVAKLSTFVQATGGLRRSMGSNSAWEREVLEESPQALLVLALFRVYFGVYSFKETIRQDSWCAVSRTGDKYRVEVVLLDKSVLFRKKVISM